MFKGKRANTIIHTIILTVVSVVIGLSFYNWNARSLVGNNMPMPFGYGISVVLSGSMEPALQINDGIIVKELKENDRINPDDIIVFESGNMLVVHRVISVNGDEIITQGDANNTEDAPITRDRIKGKMIYRIPGLGRAIQIIRQPQVILILIVLLVFTLKSADNKQQDKDNRELQEIMEEINRLKDEMK